MRHRLVCIISLFFLFVFNAFANEWPVPFIEGELKFKNGRITVISGAGPAGLMAASAILKSGKHDQIIIVENRPSFSRFNLLNYFPESWPMFKMLGVNEVFEKFDQNIDLFGFYQEHPQKEPVTFSVDKEKVPTSFDYRGKVLEMFKMPGVGMRVINIADLQNALAGFLIKDPKIYFVRGTITLSAKPDNNLMHTIDLDHQINEFNSKHYQLKPDLVVITEGAHSKNRTNVGIKLKPVLKQEQWCSGAVSLAGITEKTTRLMQVLDKTKEGQSSARAFGIFNLKPQELFLTAQANENESVDDCLKRNAAELINYAESKNVLPDSIIVKNKSQGIIDITPSTAEKFSSGKNVVLYGDAAGFGTPKSGIGLSLITSVYSQALLDLLEQWDNNREEVINKFNSRVSEIVDYWHKRIASDDEII